MRRVRAPVDDTCVDFLSSLSERAIHAGASLLRCVCAPTLEVCVLPVSVVEPKDQPPEVVGAESSVRRVRAPTLDVCVDGAGSGP